MEHLSNQTQNNLI